MTTIILDPGHGGTDRAGKSSPAGYSPAGGPAEKTLTLALAQEVAAAVGSDVALTRTSDVNLSLAARRAAAARAGARTFVSLHASPTPSRLPEIWCHPSANAASQGLASRLSQALDGAVIRTDHPMAILDPGPMGTELAAVLLEVDHGTVQDTMARSRLAGRIASALRPMGGRSAVGIEHGAHEAYGRRAPLATAQAWVDVDLSSATTFGDIIRLALEAGRRRANWMAGIDAPVGFPYSAVCQLQMTDPNHPGSTGFGTGFFIGPNKILTCGHNFYDREPSGAIWETRSILVQPGHSIIQSRYDERTFPVTGRNQVHTTWKTAVEGSTTGTTGLGFDLAVLNVPGLGAPNGEYFTLPNFCPVPQDHFVCGFGKLDPPDDARAYADQPMRFEGGPVTSAEDEILNYAVNTQGGNSGSPVFINDASGTVIAVHTGPSVSQPGRANRGVYLTPDKLNWINGR